MGRWVTEGFMSGGDLDRGPVVGFSYVEASQKERVLIATKVTISDCRDGRGARIVISDGSTEYGAGQATSRKA